VAAGPLRRREDAEAAAAAERLAQAVSSDVRARLAARGGMDAPDLAAVTDEVREAVSQRGLVLGVEDLRATTDRVRDALWGLGPLAVLLRDPTVSDVLVNGGDGVYVERAGVLERSDVVVGGEAELRGLAVRLAAAAGRRLDDAAPWVDARLPGGLRLHAVLPAVAPGGTHVSIRRIRPAHHSLDALIEAGAMPRAWRVVLRALIEVRRTFLISGGTGAGKTTLLGALLGLVPAQERILLVEDVAELAPAHPHVVRLEARPPNVEGTGGVTVQDLVRQALRMRPDRLVVGECRGAEVRDLLAALNTGHAGGCGTLHANAAQDVPARVEALGALAGLTPSAVRVQFAAAVDAILHVERVADRRVLSQIAVVVRDGHDRLEVRPALLRAAQAGGADGRAGSGHKHGDGLSVTGPGWPILCERLRLDGRGTGRAEERVV
jgi:pilus assembly protein CpaF